jgi:hypothetical protein
MKRLLLVLALVVAGAVALGFYRGWWSLASDGAGDKVHLTLTVDKDQIHEDKDKALRGVRDLGHKAKGEAAPPVQPPRNPD